MTLEDLKIKQLTNQYLVEPGDKMTVIRDLCGMQAQFMTNVMHSLRIRCNDYNEATLKDHLVKNWTIRGTVHAFAEDDLPLFLHCADGKNYRRNEWTDCSWWNQRADWALTLERQAYLSSVILEALEKAPRTREELRRICQEAGMGEQEGNSMFDPWGGGIRELCERGFLNYVVQEKKMFCLSPAFTPMPEEEAGLEMARRYFTNMGPATIHDAMYFFHTTAAQVKKWIDRLPVADYQWEGKTYYAIDNGKQYNRDIPGCLFLAGFDQLMLGYEKKESLYLDPGHMRDIFNLAGIVMPALMLDGKVVGRWKKKERKLRIQLFVPLSPGDRAAVKEKAEALWDDIASLEGLS